MSDKVHARVVMQEGLHFVGTADSGHTIHLDSPLSDETHGPTPMEVALMSLAGCSAMDVISILRKKRHQVHAFEIEVEGTRAERYPKPYTLITLHYILRGPAIDNQSVERAIELSRENYCPIWNMLAHSVEIRYTYQISE